MPDAYYGGVPDVRPVFDYSGDGIRRSVEDSLERTGLGRIDILYIHDPDTHMEAALRDAWPALERLRAEGTVGAIGLGMNTAEALAWFCARATPDVLLVAGRYTILDQSALVELLPRCEADGDRGGHRRGDEPRAAGGPQAGCHVRLRAGGCGRGWHARSGCGTCARRTRCRCARPRCSSRSRHPTVVCVVAGVRRIAHLDEYPELMAAEIPAALWSDLRAEGLIDAAAPVPVGA